MRKRRKEISEQLIELANGLDAVLALKKVQLMKENLQLLEQEETYWRNRCHEQWLLKGDNNTSYFHKIASGRKRKNKVISLENEGRVIEGDDNLLKHATEYYTSLFGPEPEHNIRIDQELWNEIEHVTDSENEELCKPFSATEIKEALFQMDKKQSSWPR